jgi:hypothetical protein
MIKVYLKIYIWPIIRYEESNIKWLGGILCKRGGAYRQE